MTLRNFIRYSVYISALILLSLILYVIYLSLALDGVWVEERTLAYYALINSSFIKNFPQPGKRGKERYHFWSVEAARSASYSESYESSTGKESYKAVFHQHLTNHGYERTDNYRPESNEMIYEHKRGDSVNIIFISDSETIYPIEIIYCY